MILATFILLILSAYLMVGLLFGLWFVTAGVTRIDSAAQGAPWGFRILILPGSMALWPLLWSRIRSRRQEHRS